MDSANQKSNAPWILGVVGTAISIPQICCSVICASAYLEIAHDPMQTESQANTAAGLSVWSMLPVVTTAICFVLSFFGKSGAARMIGVALILAAVANFVFCLLNFSMLGTAASVCFLFAGVSSICNAKR